MNRTRMNENQKVTLTLKQLKKLVKENSGEDYPEMTDEIAEENNVVAAMCCRWCDHHKDFSKGEVICTFLGCKSYDTDVCDHYSQGGETFN